MNKKELIEKYESLECVVGSFSRKMIIKSILRDLKQLDEPEKVKVSEEEAKFLETFDFDRDSDITKALYYVSRAGWGHQITDNNNVEMKDLTEDVVFFVKNRKRLIKAILFGYEVEKEKRYWVKLKAVDQYLVSVKDENFLGFLQSKLRSKFTRKQLEEAGFGDVFDSPLFEVEEVTE